MDDNKTNEITTILRNEIEELKIRLEEAIGVSDVLKARLDHLEDENAEGSGDKDLNDIAAACRSAFQKLANERKEPLVDWWFP